MGDLGPSLPPRQVIALQAAWRQWSELVGRLPPGRIVVPGGLWTGLLVACLVCAASVLYNGPATELFMGAIALAAFLSSIAGFAFSAICGAMLF